MKEFMHWKMFPDHFCKAYNGVGIADKTYKSESYMILTYCIFNDGLFYFLIKVAAKLVGHEDDIFGMFVVPKNVFRESFRCENR